MQDAIEGKLTADWRKNNPDIEPASQLLKRIQAEKQQLIKDGKIKKQKLVHTATNQSKQLKNFYTAEKLAVVSVGKFSSHC